MSLESATAASSPASRSDLQHTSRACNRCVSRKRKCDHSTPRCGPCERANEDCVYVTAKRKRGPVAGFSRIAEERAQACEDALWFLLQTTQAQFALAPDQNKHPFPPCPLRIENPSDRLAHYAAYPLTCPADLEHFRQGCLRITDTGGGYDGDTARFGQLSREWARSKGPAQEQRVVREGSDPSPVLEYTMPQNSILHGVTRQSSFSAESLQDVQRTVLPLPTPSQHTITTRDGDSRFSTSLGSHQPPHPHMPYQPNRLYDTGLSSAIAGDSDIYW